jgi:Holliday junction resolvasome RuvABC endonuclease subunit
VNAPLPGMPPPTPRVIGIDPSIAATGLATVKGDMLTVGGKPELGDTRLAFIHQEVLRVCRSGKPDLAVLEDSPANTQGSGVLGMVQGVIRLALLECRVPYALIVPATLKKYATGRGKCDKGELRMALYRRAGIDNRDNDQVDAWWLRHMGLDRLGDPVVALPAAQRASLDVPHWPPNLDEWFERRS